MKATKYKGKYVPLPLTVNFPAINKGCFISFDCVPGLRSEIGCEQCIFKNEEGRVYMQTPLEDTSEVLQMWYKGKSKSREHYRKLGVK